MRNQRFAFVLRIWFEQNTSGQSPQMVLRGSLQLVNTNEIHYFTSLDELPQLLRTLTDWSDQSGLAHGGKEETNDPEPGPTD